MQTHRLMVERCTTRRTNNGNCRKRKRKRPLIVTPPSGQPHIAIVVIAYHTISHIMYVHIRIGTEEWIVWWARDRRVVVVSVLGDYLRVMWRNEGQ